jgi:hypothetical protein
MSIQDLSILQLQYEILNTPMDQLAADAGLPLSLLEKEAERLGWARKWPDEDWLPVPEDTTDVLLQEMSEAELRAEKIAQEIEQYTETARQRLKVYSLAKEILLAHKYLALEVSIVNQAKDMTDKENITAAELKALSSLYKDLRSTSNLGNIAGISIGTDDSGIPTAIIKDLTGNK